MFYKFNIYLLIVFIFASCTNKEKELIIIKQWHIDANINTGDINHSLKFPQHINQKDIYLFLKNKIKQGSINAIIAEGCEGEIKKDSKLVFNSWDLNKLNNLNNKEDLENVLAHVPLKLKAKFKDKVKVFCGDNNDLIKEHQVALSNIRGYYGYYIRLNQYKGKNKKEYNVYLKSLENIEKQEIKEPIQYLVDKIKINFEKYNEILKERNSYFVELIKANRNKYNQALVIGGMHYDDLVNKLKDHNIKYTSYIPSGYDKNVENLLKEIIEDITN